MSIKCLLSGVLIGVFLFGVVIYLEVRNILNKFNKGVVVKKK